MINKLTCDRCHKLYHQPTTGHDGLCPVCAERETKIKTQHTPGNWIAVQILPDIINIRSTETGNPVPGPGGFTVKPGDPEALANARLTAAGPQLLAALKRLSFAAACRDNTQGDPCRLIQAQSELLQANQEAIAAIHAADFGPVFTLDEFDNLSKS